MSSPLSPLVSPVAEKLAGKGMRCLVIGRSAWAARRGTATPADTTLLCEASAERLHQLPGVVCLGRGLGVRACFATGSVLLLPAGDSLEAGLERAAWTVLGFGLEPISGEWVDPCGGATDLAADRLHPGARVTGLDPHGAVAAIRLACEQGLRPSPEALAVWSGAAPLFAEPGGAPIRHELEAMLLGRDPQRGLEWLREAGIEAQLIPGASPFAAQWVAASAPHRTARWSAWLTGARAARVLARLRMPRDRARRVEARLAYGRAEQAIAAREASVRRAVARLGSATAVREVLELRRRELESAGELAPEVCSRLEAIEALLDAPVGPRLVWTGRDVMKNLDLPAGPEIGRALAFLRQQVAADPAGNHPSQLRRWLGEWAEDAQAPGTPGRAYDTGESLDPGTERD